MDTYDSHRSGTEARQANRRLDNFWVLLISMAGIVAVFAIVFLIFLVQTPVTTIAG